MLNSKQQPPLDPGIERAFRKFLHLNNDLRININELHIMEEFFASTHLFGKMSGQERSQLITGCNTTVRFFYEIEMNKLEQRLKPHLFQ